MQQHRQIALQHLFQDRDDGGAEDGAPDITRAADDRDEEIFDAGLRAERRAFSLFSMMSTWYTLSAINASASTALPHNRQPHTGRMPMLSHERPACSQMNAAIAVSTHCCTIVILNSRMRARDGTRLSQR